ncbi:Formate--tetrahydrofolate ligase [Beijerinckiaceae bacterium RH AL1]|jgi:formate--tetrahydrofolate ligase|nr:formate--tetrahydrofolate ligase [Beijerinckiaceae bacterium]VVB47030.1 Formate--tetrahydrofolate ligase [Beijerinckiaceae bacterium RH CH11]VVB47113.1 Formate--tetrahydrofolate ligase [Beijerinckiaceae bacterium RH AL8]VVC55680.1 Formate--tetrahydrofolate ligase [Beijerinckiaceae bacterium RH AL1]
MPTDIEIARAKTPEPMAKVAARIDIPEDALLPYGKTIAKIDPGFVAKTAQAGKKGKLILVTAISPTPAGEGKTTTTVGLADALRQIGKKSATALREPALGPCFGVKGGAAGGGHAQVIPMEQINLHFTGDFHAISSANNLLAALIDNHIYHGNPLDIDARRVTWARSVDMNDRALRNIVCSLGGVANGFPREARFDILVASEIMAVFCLSKDFTDLQERLKKMVIGQTRGKEFVTAEQLQAVGSMTVLLQDAFSPNLVQTLEGTPAFIHGGPFANIAHGCNSVVATNLALGLADYVVTEAGFGADLGAEKFFDIKARQAGLNPEAVVIVATVRALKMHGGVAKDQLGTENLEALKKGMANLGRHIENVKKFGVKPVVGINAFVSDTEAEFELIRKTCREEFDTDAVLCRHWAEGGKGATELAEKVVAIIESGESKYKPLYELEQPIADKMRIVAKEIYRAKDIAIESKAKTAIKSFEDQGYGNLPICVAKTQYSFSADPKALNAPTDHTVPVVDARLSAGAGFVVLLCGDIMTLPGLSANPSAHKIGLDEKGEIVGLF